MRACFVALIRQLLSTELLNCSMIGLKRDGTVVAVDLSVDGQCNVSDWTDIGNGLTLD